ncbi:hypothetical protein RHMOL_Rhmol07G0072700 [Rhododendron molle]|uniref:Uncharacterized protein n=1 Tax=Rhododendron molle TaxID=49168 RepID=A0ACC0MZG0_RHOML|nr:hypothetical protein RHMOL_Rhmol07G0072700 [Rhododendron molle]
MDDGEIEIPDQGFLSNPYPSSTIQTSSSIDSFLDEFLKKTRTCTHTHTCNPPGPDSAHTHTCYHTHTRLFLSGEENPAGRQQRPLGNREAVRKYREKKKAHMAYLEENVKKLRLLNQQLVRKLQGQAILEAEISRLRGLLTDLGGKIDGELGVFSLCNPTSSFKEGGCGLDSNGSALVLERGNEVPCFHPHLGASMVASGGGRGGKLAVAAVPWQENCQPAVIDCRANTNDVVSAEEI